MVQGYYPDYVSLGHKAGSVFGLHKYLIVSRSGHLIGILLAFSIIVILIIKENRAYVVHTYHP